MKKGKKILNFIQMASKIEDRSQEEILKLRKQKRDDLLEKLKRKKNS
jgi:hypothetical protein